MITVKEIELDDDVLSQLISLSEDWENENSCYGYQKNTLDDIKGNRIFAAIENGKIIGYLFGHKERTERETSIYPKGKDYFELEELYVKPAFRSKGIGKALFQYVEECVRDEVDLIMLGTATKNYRAILHFYIDELDMTFWSARLFKHI